VIGLSGGCRRHRPALFDFVDRGEITPGTASALGHLDRCQRCTWELESTVLAITALRRLGDEAARAEPRPDAWPRLRDRIDRWRPVRWAIMSPTTGTVMSVALVAMLIVPLRVGGAGAASSDPSIAPTDRSAAALVERRAEAQYISTMTRKGTLPATVVVVRSTGAIPKSYPDGIRPERKEVSPVAPTERPTEAS
jgi:anti-sigma factor RsiW